MENIKVALDWSDDDADDLFLEEQMMDITAQNNRDKPPDPQQTLARPQSDPKGNDQGKSNRPVHQRSQSNTESSKSFNRDYTDSRTSSRPTQSSTRPDLRSEIDSVAEKMSRLESGGMALSRRTRTRGEESPKSGSPKRGRSPVHSRHRNDDNTSQGRGSSPQSSTYRPGDNNRYSRYKDNSESRERYDQESRSRRRSWSRSRRRQYGSRSRSDSRTRTRGRSRERIPSGSYSSRWPQRRSRSRSRSRSRERKQNTQGTSGYDRQYQSKRRSRSRSPPEAPSKAPASPSEEKRPTTTLQTTSTMRIKPEIGDTVPRTLISNPTLAVQPSASTLAGQVRSSTQQPLDAAQSLQPKEAFKLVDDGSSSETKIATRRYFVMRCKGNALEEAMTQNWWPTSPLYHEKLQQAYKFSSLVFLIFTEHLSGEFCGVARMTSEITWIPNRTICDISKYRQRMAIEWISKCKVSYQSIKSILGLKSYEIHCRHGQEIVQAAGQHVLQLLAEMAPETSSVISSATTGAVSLSGHNSTPTISYSRNTPVQSNSRPSAAPTLVPQKRALSPTLGFELDTTGQRPISLKPRPQDIVSPAVMFEMHDNDFKMEASPELVPPPSAPKTNTTPMRFSLVPAELSKTQRKKQRKLARMAPLSFPKPKV